MSQSEYKVRYFGSRQSVCAICKKHNGKGSKKLTVHHKISLAEGGEDEIGNIEILCFDCHRKKHGYANKRSILDLDKVLEKIIN